MFLLASRTVMAAIFTIILLAATGKLDQLWSIFKNKKQAKTPIKTKYTQKRFGNATDLFI